MNEFKQGTEILFNGKPFVFLSYHKRFKYLCWIYERNFKNLKRLVYAEEVIIK